MGKRFSRIGARQERANPLRARRGYGTLCRARSCGAARLQALRPISPKRSPIPQCRRSSSLRRIRCIASRSSRARSRQARLLRKAARADQGRRADHDSRVRARRRGARRRAQPALVALDAEDSGARSRAASSGRSCTSKPFQQRGTRTRFPAAGGSLPGIPGGGMTGAGLHVLDAFIHLAGASAARACAAARAQARARAAGHRLRDLRIRERRKRAPRHRAGDAALLRVHVFGANGSAEALGENELVLHGAASQRPQPRTRRLAARGAGNVRQRHRSTGRVPDFRGANAGDRGPRSKLQSDPSSPMRR